ncbi:hypothetical protein [Cupriavidus consociatus]|uniref:hypothetical protein n=1 Tax=Cupriavidus consociatus TaxID=2821357 RepID=UPI001AE380DE|nr:MULTISPECIES: hypothetical protein [unclassified Cupriavidus]MBP0625165.1 hypothetical protein [Cupriavidus sp. LEh25]MDK2661906.1 hypothetical protein [Cupriavidus sp. LEh21]
MAKLGIKDAFAKYGATLRNVQWSVSSWTANGALVVSLWDHHRQPGMPGTLEFADKASRWHGPGNREFRENVAKAFDLSSEVRLVIVRTADTERVEAGGSASSIPKEFFVRDDLIGQVVEWNGDNYRFRFIRE